MACDRNPKVLQYQEKFHEREWEMRATFGNFLPTATASLGYTAMNDPLVMNLDPIRDAMLRMQTLTYTKMAVDSFVRAHGLTPTSPAIAGFAESYQKGTQTALDAALPHFIDTLKEKNYPSAQLTLTQPIFMGGRICAAHRAAHDEYQSALAELRQTTNVILQETFSNYISLALINKVVEVRSNVLTSMRRHEKDATELYENGIIAKSALLRAKVAVAEAEQAFSNDTNKRYLARLALAKSLNLPDTILPETSDTLCLQSIKETIKSLINRADSSQPLLAILNAKSDAAKAKVIAERALFLPKAALFGKLELFPDHLSALEPTWAAGITVSIDLFTGGKNISRVQTAKHLVNEIYFLTEATKADIHLLIQKTWLECQNATDHACN